MFGTFLKAFAVTLLLGTLDVRAHFFFCHHITEIVQGDNPDIRAGIALLIAAMSANGTSRIDNIAQIDRGYEDIEARLNNLGAKIERIS